MLRAVAKLLTVAWVGFLFGSATVFAQDEKKAPPARASLSFQLIRTNGSEIFMEQDVRDPNAKPVTQEYSVKIPVTVTKIVDGKTVTATEYREETRSRTVIPTKRKSIPVTDGFVFTDFKGKKIPKITLIGKLGMGSGKMVVMVYPGRKLSPTIKEVLDENTIFLQIGMPTGRPIRRVPPPLRAPRIRDPKK